MVRSVSTTEHILPPPLANARFLKFNMHVQLQGEGFW